MSCLWCQDEELAAQTLQVVQKWKDLDDGDTFRRAIQDFYSCSECINSYHTIKMQSISNEQELEMLEEFEKLRVSDHLSKVLEVQERSAKKVFEFYDYDLGELFRPVVESIQYPYLLMDEAVLPLLEKVVCWMVENKNNLERYHVDVDHNYPGLLILLFNRNAKVREWSSTFLRSIPNVSNTTVHEYLSTIHLLMNILLEQHEAAKTELSDFPSMLPSFVCDVTDKNIVFNGYAEMFSMLQSQVIGMIFSNETRKQFVVKVVEKIEETGDLFWPGLRVLVVLLDKLKTSFWLVSTAFDSPNKLLHFITMHKQFRLAVDEAAEFYYKEGINENIDMLMSNDAILDIELEVAKIHSNCKCSKIFSWFSAFLKTILKSDFKCYDILKSLLDFVIPFILENPETSELYMCASACLVQLFQYVFDTRSTVALKPFSRQLTEILVRVMQLGSEQTRSYQFLSSSFLKLTSSLVSRSKSMKVINDQEFFSFQSNWKRLGSNRDYEITIIKDTLTKTFEMSIDVKLEDDDQSDDKRAIQEQIKLMQNLGSAESPINLDDDEMDENDRQTALGEISYIQISDSDDDDDDDEDGDGDGNMNGMNIKQEPIDYSQMAMVGSQSPIQISDDDDDDFNYDDGYHGDNVIVSDDVGNSEIDGISNSQNTTDKDVETTHQQIDFLVEESDEEKTTFKRKHVEDDDNDLILQQNEKRQKDDLPDIRRNPTTEPKKLDWSALQAKLSSGLNKDKLLFNRRKITSKEKEVPTSADVNNKVTKDPELNSPIENADLYQNQFYDIGSKFSTNTERSQPTFRKNTVKKFPQSLRRESLEKNLAVIPAKKSPAATKPPVKRYTLPDISTRKTYTVDLFQDSILACDPKFLQEGRDLEVKSQLNSVSFSFDSYDQYVKTFWPLMLLETCEQLRRDWEVSLHVQKPYIIESYEETKNVRTRFLRCHHIEKIEKSRKVPSYDEHPIQNDLVLLRYSKEQKGFGIIYSVERNKQKDSKTNQPYRKFTLGVLVKNYSALATMKHVNIIKLSSLTTVLRQWKAMIGFQSSLLAKDILKPFRQQTYTMRAKLIPRSDSLKTLNADQFQALSSVFRAVEQPFTIPKICLIQGPPGTGKSYTVKKIITQLLQEMSKSTVPTSSSSSSKKDVYNRNRILVCAPSNAAIDEIVKRLRNSPPKLPSNCHDENPSLRKSNCGDFRLLRVGHRSQVEPSLHGYTLDYLVEREMNKLKFFNDPQAVQKEMKRMRQILDKLDHSCVKLKMSSEPTKMIEYNEKIKEREKCQQRYDEMSKQMERASKLTDIYQERKKYAKNQLLHADIICCTLSGSGSDWMVKTFKDTENRVPFNCVIIDEAGQCVEPDALIPLQYGTSKLIMVGDHCQLPATVFSKKANRYNFGQSLFERMIYSLSKYRQTCSDMNKDEKAALMLTTQYRMAREICAFPSKKFYSGRLRPAKIVGRNNAWLLKQYVVINLKGSEKKVSSGALHNPTERDYVLKLCQMILKETKLAQQYIGIITPYRQQVEYIKKELVKNDMKSVTVNTIDGYQGQEKKIVILSCVRGPNQRNTIGFLSHPQRMNVALTRAMETLIILANRDSVEVDEDWKDLFEDADSRNVLVDAETTHDAMASVLKGCDIPKKPSTKTTRPSITASARRTVMIETPAVNPLVRKAETTKGMPEEQCLSNAPQQQLTSDTTLYGLDDVIDKPYTVVPAVDLHVYENICLTTTVFKDMTGDTASDEMSAQHSNGQEITIQSNKLFRKENTVRHGTKPNGRKQARVTNNIHTEEQKTTVDSNGSTLLEVLPNQLLSNLTGKPTPKTWQRTRFEDANMTLTAGAQQTDTKYIKSKMLYFSIENNTINSNTSSKKERSMIEELRSDNVPESFSFKDTTVYSQSPKHHFSTERDAEDLAMLTDTPIVTNRKTLNGACCNDNVDDDSNDYSCEDFRSFIDTQLENVIDQQYFVDKPTIAKLKEGEMNEKPSVEINPKAVTNAQQRKQNFSERIEKLLSLQREKQQQHQQLDVKNDGNYLQNLEDISPPDNFSEHSPIIPPTIFSNSPPSISATSPSPLLSPGSDATTTLTKKKREGIFKWCASNRHGVDSTSTAKKITIKPSYPNLPHRHEGGTRCVVVRKHRKEMEAIEGKKTEDCVKDDSKCGGPKHRRNIPSKAYFSFPHRHHDGTFCETACQRVLERENKRASVKPNESAVSSSTATSGTTEWRLYPIEQ